MIKVIINVCISITIIVLMTMSFISL